MALFGCKILVFFWEITSVVSFFYHKSAYLPNCLIFSSSIDGVVFWIFEATSFITAKLFWFLPINFIIHSLAHVQQRRFFYLFVNGTLLSDQLIHGNGFLGLPTLCKRQTHKFYRRKRSHSITILIWRQVGILSVDLVLLMVSYLFQIYRISSFFECLNFLEWQTWR